MAALLAMALLGGLVVLRAVTEPKNDFRFSIMGDRTGGAQPEIYGRVWREIELLHPDFVINVGDTIQGGQDATSEAEWRDLRPIWERYKHFPLYFTPGNHDIWSEASREIYERQSGRRRFYSFNWQDAHFTVLDNSRGNDLGQDQLQFLEQDLTAHKSRRPKFVLFHKPFWIPLLRLGSGEFPLHQIARKHGVEYVISGHGHQFVRLARDGIVYMEVGSSGGSIRRGTDKGLGFEHGFFFHHVWGRVKGSKVSMTVKEIDGVKGLGRMFRAEDWAENGPQFEVADPARKDSPKT